MNLSTYLVLNRIDDHRTKNINRFLAQYNTDRFLVFNIHVKHFNQYQKKKTLFYQQFLSFLHTINDDLRQSTLKVCYRDRKRTEPELTF